ncbi:MAG: ATP-binding protein [Bacteroidales bacterium]|nr:ATP-binding protein [Bacteroidales bacterium]
MTLTCNVPPDTTIIGDEHLFHHLIKIFIDNAVKYTDQGSVTIMAQQIQQEDRQMVSVSIKDTGIGIAQENYKMIFEAFRQVSEGYGRQFEGSGLGLTIANKIINLLQGSLGLTSKVGEGSEFIVLLPSSDFIKAPKTELKSLKGQLKQSQTRKKFPDVLIVEDNLVNIQLLMIYIRKYCNIFTTLDAKSAIDITQQRLFDAILMDINLGPGMDGIQAMLEIRKQPNYHDIPILAVTGYVTIGDRERLLKIGFTDYIPKPYDKETIAKVMTDLFPKE